MYKPIIHNASTKFGNNRWKSYSIKIHREVFLFSDLEYDNWLLTECNPNVISFCEQPFEIKLPFKSRIRSSIPDMWVLYDNGDEEIVEVKYLIDLNKPRVIEQIGIQKEWCKANKIRHKVLTDCQIRESAILLSNYKFIIKMLKHKNEFDFDIYAELIRQIQVHSHIGVSELSEQLKLDGRVTLEHIAYLLFRGEICADLSDKHFGPKTEVWCKDETRLR
ncbi:TnsA endonuclease N-terminal domain-containing protein [Sporosarcina koreensis]|uniref:TnsA endonuclease N-terminal domain-containing protein n=1 Tax=Sporosarcina koreensis TaxID=334735 RepID=A0ABW0TYG5_9BACL